MSQAFGSSWFGPATGNNSLESPTIAWRRRQPKGRRERDRLGRGGASSADPQLQGGEPRRLRCARRGGPGKREIELVRNLDVDLERRYRIATIHPDLDLVRLE